MGAIELKNRLFREMIQLEPVDGAYTVGQLPLKTQERSPMIDMRECRKKFYPQSR